MWEIATSRRAHLSTGNEETGCNTRLCRRRETVFGVCIVKELLHNILSLRYALVTVLFVVLALGATVVRTAVYQKQLQDYADLQNRTTEAMTDMQRWGTWGTSKNFSYSVEKAPNPLAIFAFGLENEITRSYSQGGWYDPYLGPRKLQTPGFQYNLAFDLATIVCIVGSLLALVLSFDAVCGEAERGTLKVMLCGALPRDTIVLAKMCAGAFTILVPLAIGWTLCLLYVTAIAGVTLGPQATARLTGIIVLCALYVVFFQALGTAISSLVQRSATSLAVALFGWVVLVLIVPNAVPLVAARLAPIPQLSKLNAEKDALPHSIVVDSGNVWSISAFETGRFKSVEQMWGVELLPKLNIESARRAAKLDAMYQARVSNQVDLAQALSRFSPAAAFMYAVSSYAGTGVPDFMRIVRDHQVYYQRFTVAMAELQTKAMQIAERDPRAHNACDQKAYPPFEPSITDVGRAAQDSLIDTGYLSLGAVFLFLACFAGFLRYRLD
jgi:ABC-type transport system involved in multi-copper enzyme maturation permease subunit